MIESRKDLISESNFDDYFTIVSMPEFLAEGTAITDLVHPQRVVIGTPCSPLGRDAYHTICNLYENFQTNTKIIHCKQASSELGKLMSNAMLAQRISSINSITALCEKEQAASVKEVKSIISEDARIGDSFLQCSIGFGGSCFEKDLQSLIYILDSNEMHEEALYW
mmetsp:Transcript_28196/g.20396  ORF Transcript_28196/g.20396 Transcript_28196/m.20396 type:complete len:166 (+) Transcript_28196:198-695(+)